MLNNYGDIIFNHMSIPNGDKVWILSWTKKNYFMSAVINLKRILFDTFFFNDFLLTFDRMSQQNMHILLNNQ